MAYSNLYGASCGIWLHTHAKISTVVGPNKHMKAIILNMSDHESFILYVFDN